MQRYFSLQAGIFILAILQGLFLGDTKPGYAGGNLSVFQFVTIQVLGSGVWTMAAILLAAAVYMRSLSDLGLLVVVGAIGFAIVLVIVLLTDPAGPPVAISPRAELGAALIMLGLQIFAPLAAMQIVTRFSSSVGYVHAHANQLFPFYLVLAVWTLLRLGFIANSQFKSLYLVSFITIGILIIYGRWIDSKIVATGTDKPNA
jgi:hypothetical protein